MKKTYTCAVEINNVWLVVIEHNESAKSREFMSHKIFEKYEDAKNYLWDEISRIGRNILSQYDKGENNVSYNHSVDKYESFASIFVNGVKVDGVGGILYKEKIN